MPRTSFPSPVIPKQSYTTLIHKRTAGKDATAWLKKHPQPTQMPLSVAQLAELFSSPSAFGNASTPSNASAPLRKRKGRGLSPPSEHWTMTELAEAIRKEIEKRA